MTRSPRRIAARLLAVTAALALVGCGRRGPPTYPVAGTVRLDGMPVEPEKYNISSTLTLDVQAGENRRDFKLVTR